MQQNATHSDQPEFIEKLHSKRQSTFQKQQAQKAIKIYFGLIAREQQNKQTYHLSFACLNFSFSSFGYNYPLFHFGQF